MRKKNARALRGAIYAILLALTAALIWRWLSLERWQAHEREAPPLPTIVSLPSPLPPAVTPTATRAPVVGNRKEAARLFNGITYHSELETMNGGPASEERVDPESYALEMKLKVRVPVPNRTLDELTKNSPEIGTVLPCLSAMVKPEAVSPLFTQLYETKVRQLRDNLSRLDLLLSRHNFNDCQTVLQLEHPETHRRVLLWQADMDVDADGSDGDRVPAGNGVSATFKPFTSFRWSKKTPAPNPYLPATEEKLRRIEIELKKATSERKRELKNSAAELRDEVSAMKKFSYLIGTTDPFIVMPGSFGKGKDAAKVGDYAVVVAGNSIYPAIVGDVGPSDKIGEASLRIARQINAASNPNNRPMSDLQATYLVFNGTADSSWGPPDLDKLQARCEALVKEIGGASVPLHHWENIIPPPPTPTPSTTPIPSATPTPLSTPEATASPTSTFAFPTATPSASVTR